MHWLNTFYFYLNSMELHTCCVSCTGARRWTKFFSPLCHIRWKSICYLPGRDSMANTSKRLQTHGGVLLFDKSRIWRDSRKRESACLHLILWTKPFVSTLRIREKSKAVAKRHSLSGTQNHDQKTFFSRIIEKCTWVSFRLVAWLFWNFSKI